MLILIYLAPGDPVKTDRLLDHARSNNNAISEPFYYCPLLIHFSSQTQCNTRQTRQYTFCSGLKEKKKEIWLILMTKASKNFDDTTISDPLRSVSFSNINHPFSVVKPVQKHDRKFENQLTKHKRHQKLRLHNDCLGRSVGVTNHPTGVVKPVYGYLTFPLTTKAV